MPRKHRIVPHRQRQQRIAVGAPIVLERRERVKVGDAGCPETNELVASCKGRGGSQLRDHYSVERGRNVQPEMRTVRSSFLAVERQY